jgi:hypothetical protein
MFVETLAIAIDLHDDEVALLPQPRPGFKPFSFARRAVRRVLWAIVSAAEWVFGIASLIFGLSILAALPILQLLSLGYLLEAASRVARTGRLRDGVIGVRPAARVGGIALGVVVSLIPLWLARSFAESAAVIDPDGRGAVLWRAGVILVSGLTVLHVATSLLRGAHVRHFVWPPGNAFWLVRRLRRPGLYVEARDGFWDFVVALHLPHYFRVGLVSFFGTLVWLIPPAILISLGGRLPVVGVAGVLLLAIIVPFLPFLQVHYAVEGRAAALFDRKAARERFRRAPWAFAFALMVLLLASIPLYLLKIEMIPREAAWLPSLVFVIFLAPARLLTGWAYARSGRRDRPRHWLFRAMGRLAIIPAAALYVLVVFVGQYTSWGGTLSLYEQHAFLLPVPFLNM